MLRLEISLRRNLSAILTFVSVAIPVSFLKAQDVFPDKALEAAVRREVFDKRYNTEPITADDVKNISQVVGKGKGIKNLEGLQHCKVIMKLDLENNEIVDLTPIKELKQLQSIDLSSNKIESLEPISQLVNSQYLQLSKNAISDLSPLKDMSNLRSLYISDNKIKSLEPLAVLKKMWSLNVAGNPIDNLTPISQLKGLDSINLKGCGIKSVEFIRNLNPNFLMLQGNPIEDFGPLVEACEADSKAERRFAQFLKLYVDEDALKNEKNATAFERLRSFYVKINPANK
ncbi:MAG: leucine-rich repeat domain-containing protein [Pirellula sp.]